MVDHPVLNDSETYKFAEFKLICSPGSSNPSTVELSLKKGNILKNLCFTGVERIQIAGEIETDDYDPGIYDITDSFYHNLKTELKDLDETEYVGNSVSRNFGKRV